MGWGWGAWDLPKWRGQHTGPRVGEVAQSALLRGSSRCPGAVKCARAQCPEPLPSSKPALFLLQRNNFLLPPAQDARVAGRSSRPQLGSRSQTTTLLPPGHAVLSRVHPWGRNWPGSRVQTRVTMPRRPQQLFLPTPQGHLSGFPTEGPAWASGARGYLTQGHRSGTPTPARACPRSAGPGWLQTPTMGA